MYTEIKEFKWSQAERLQVICHQLLLQTMTSAEGLRKYTN